MRRLDAWASGWFSGEFVVSNRGLAICRVVFALFLCAVVCGDYARALSWLVEMPDALYYPPPGPMMWSPGFAPAWLLWTVWGALSCASFGLLVGWRTRVMSVSVGLAIMCLDGYLFSLGKIDHGRILLMWFPLLMSMSSWGAWGSCDARAQRAGDEVVCWPRQLFVVMVGFGLFTAGVPKILGGWLSIETQAAYVKLYENVYVLGRMDLLALPAVRTVEWRAFWEVQDWLTVAFEVGFLLSTLRERWFRRFIVLALCFHWGVMLTMNIVFPEQLLTYAMCVSFAGARGDALDGALARLSRTPTWQLVIAAGVSVLGAVAITQGVLIPHTPGGVTWLTWLIYLGAWAVVAREVALTRPRRAAPRDA